MYSPSPDSSLWNNKPVLALALQKLRCSHLACKGDGVLRVNVTITFQRGGWNTACGEASEVPVLARKQLLRLSTWLCHVHFSVSKYYLYFRPVKNHSKMVWKLNDGICKHNWNWLIWFLQLVFVEIEEFCQILLSSKKKKRVRLFIVIHFLGLCTVGTQPSVEHQSAVQNGRWAVYFPQSLTE